MINSISASVFKNQLKIVALSFFFFYVVLSTTCPAIALRPWHTMKQWFLHLSLLEAVRVWGAPVSVTLCHSLGTRHKLVIKVLLTENSEHSGNQLIDPSKA